MDRNLQVLGFSEIDKILKTLPAEIERNVMRGALRAGLTEIKKQAAENLDAAGAVDSGALKGSMRIAFQRRSVRFGWIRLRLIAGNRKPINDPRAAYYAHMVEFGTASFYTGSGKSIGRPYIIKPKNGGALKLPRGLREQVIHSGIKPRKFMRRAFDITAQAAIDATAKYLRKRIPLELAKIKS